MSQYRKDRFILDKERDNSVRLLISLNEIGGSDRARHFFQERWADMLYHVGVNYFVVTLLAAEQKLRDPHQSIKMIRSPLPRGLLDRYYSEGLQRDSIGLRATNSMTEFAWHSTGLAATMQDKELTLLREFGIHSGIILPSRVGNSHCCLACLCDNEGSEVVDRLGHHLPYIRTALNITHQNILRNYFYYYNPYSITLSDIEREIINLRRHGYTNKIIAEKLNFSLGNVKYHLANVAGRVKLLNKNEKSVTGIASIIPLLVSSGLI